eukprot:gene7917-10747_t
MGLLVEGKALTPAELNEKLKYIRDHGILQFLETWHRVKDIADDELKFGDEIECGIFVVDSEKKNVKLFVNAALLRQKLEEKETALLHESEGVTWHPEFGAWMIESTPSRPYNNYVSDLLRVERNMILRRRRLLAMIGDDKIAPTVTCFPMLGVGDFIHDPLPFDAPFSLSIYVPDYIINPHPRFAALTENIRTRRGSKVDIRVPLFHDIYTPEFNIKNSEVKNSVHDNKQNGVILEEDQSIHMDCMAFGMGMCCLQVTFQARDVDESRYMYDQLAVLAPIMLAMTAASPIFKGRLADIDCRWNVIAQSVDDRTLSERGLFNNSIEHNDQSSHINALMVGGGITLIPKSRYDSISTYIYHCNGDPLCKRTFEVYNDIPCPVDEDIKSQLKNEGIDENLAHHIAHLYIRDPLVAFHGKIEELDDLTSTDHFENIQSTNWQTCRWKPPPPRILPSDPHIGWRTEFRSMEVQLTDFENAAFTVFIVLITRVVLAFDLALYIPLSKVDENMKRAHEKNAVNRERFFFRKYVAPPEENYNSTSSSTNFGANVTTVNDNASKIDTKTSDVKSQKSDYDSIHNSTCSGIELDPEDFFEEMTMDEIFNGKDSYYPGLIPLVYAYLEYIKCDNETFQRIDQYLIFIKRRSKGELLTPATWMRNFVQSHPSYKQDSIITPDIAHDLMVTCHGIGSGAIRCPDLLGDVVIESVRKEEAYSQLLRGRLSSEERSELVKTLMNRGSINRPRNALRGKTISRMNSNPGPSDSNLKSDV